MKIHGHLFLILLCVMQPCTLFCYTFTKLDALMRNGRTEKIFPGAIALIGYKGKIIYHKAFGKQTYDPQSLPITKQTLFDLASLTKVMTTTCAMILCDSHLLSPHDYVSQYVPQFQCPEKKSIQIKHLLTHTSGLTDNALIACKNPSDIIPSLCTCEVKYPVGSVCLYSDTNFIILQKIIESITQQPLQCFIKQRITDPLCMHTTTFNPLEKISCAPTRQGALGRNYLLQGEVDDDKTFMLGGVAGHAGLFGTAEDFAKFMLMLLRNGSYTTETTQKKLIKPQTIAQWTQMKCNFENYEKGKRGYGWEVGRHLSKKAFGHFGWSGTSLWADKKLDLFCILFTNSVYPTYDNREKMKEFRVKFHDLVIEIIKK